jgi:hypothetical protein
VDNLLLLLGAVESFEVLDLLNPLDQIVVQAVVQHWLMRLPGHLLRFWRVVSYKLRALPVSAVGPLFGDFTGV